MLSRGISPRQGECDGVYIRGVGCVGAVCICVYMGGWG